ncbi:histone deacetylase family protein [Luteimonas composti]|uniref:Histone deacetylase family protein n=1 Tax=Luteimonas composti TaxID=398257 RepID=A0ABT6MT60_9GAMM|nr:histone deacetylase family protein [Luteimonas composti]MDH7453648.1 histone deacetylase family protein [Luteimonas composti]
MLGYTHPACLEHDTGPGHPECADRLGAVLEALHEAFPWIEWREAPRATRGQLLRVHDPRLLATVLAPHPSGRVRLDPDTVVSPGSPEAALRAVGAGVAATEAVMHGEADVAFCAVRPPGHHATIDAAMGFCLFDNIAVAAAHALDRFGLARVAIVDFDVHHGNGTQAIFEQEPRVLYLSSHQAPLYPWTGAGNERGAGNIVNALLHAGDGGEAFRRCWETQLLPTLDGFSPQLVLISAGFDGDRRDPMAQLELAPADFAWLTGELRRLAAHHADGRIVSMLEGGYHLQALGECAVAHVGALAGNPPEAG